MSKRSEFVTVNGVPIRVDCWGNVLPSDVERKRHEVPEELILFVPGNPGVVTFYDEFLTRLHENTKKTVWIMSHGGHDQGVDNIPSLEDNEALYNLTGQIEQKKAFIAKYLTGTKLYCVGHSIGCKMILEALKTMEGVKVEKCYFLFPTIERMAESRNGQVFTVVYQHFLWLILFGCTIFVNLPGFIQVFLLRCYFWMFGMPSNNIPALLDLIHPDVVKKSLFLADDEMKKVRLLDEVDINYLQKKVKLYYGQTDGWVPLNYYYDITKKYDGINAELCARGFEHAFVLKSSKQMADVLSEWINLPNP